MALRYLVDELRKVDPMPRRARLRMRETQRARNELAQTLHHRSQWLNRYTIHTGVQEIPVLWLGLSCLGLSSDGGVRSRFHASTIAAGSMILTDAVGHVPTEPEVARRLGVEVREHRALLDRFAPAQVGSLEAWADGVRAGARSASCRPDPGSVAEAAEDRARLV
jgi:hypothetical protein